jgi:hypothetical protein
MNNISKNAILAKVNQKEILDYYLKPYHQHPDLRAGMNISNPFNPEKQETPSFNIYVSTNGNWRYNDFATGDKGDCFDLVMKLNNLSFNETLQRINEDMGLNLEFSKSPNFEPVKSIITRVIKGEDYEVCIGEQKADAYKYYRQYYISMEVCIKYDVFPIVSYSAKSKTGKRYTISSHTDSPIFAYINEGWVKIYRPKAVKGYKFIYYGKKDKKFIFGMTQLPESGEYVIVTAGEKDVMALYAHGYPAISLNSETARCDNALAEELSKRFKNIIVLYDNDETGVKNAERLRLDFGFPVITLPAMKNNGKDISDYFAEGGTKEGFEEMITEALKKEDEQQNDANLLMKTPKVSKELYAVMPNIIREGAFAFNDERARDVFLTACLAALSACLPGVTGVYDGSTVYPNLLTFSLGPSASGKGALKWAKKMVEKYNDKLVTASRIAKKDYEQKLKDYKKNENADKEAPRKPKFIVFFIPGNTSYAKIIYHLEQNDGAGLIIESEADDVGKVMKKEWGDYSTLMRKSSDNEGVSSSKKNNDEYIDVRTSKLSMALTGTYDQLPGIVPSAENGTYSRLVLYVFDRQIGWRDVSPQAENRVNYDKHFEELSETVLKMTEFLEKKDTIIDLLPENWAELNQTFGAWLNEVSVFESSDAQSIVIRLGKTVYRIALIFTALRKYENENEEPSLFCTNEDFNTALALGEIYFKHSLLLYNNLPRNNRVFEIKNEPNRDKFYNALPSFPEVFSRQDAVAIGKRIGIKVRRVDDFLGNGLGRNLEKAEHGKYRKLKP